MRNIHPLSILFILLGINANYSKAQIINTVAGTTSAYYFCCDGGPATSAPLWLPSGAEPSGVRADNAGNFYFTDGLNSRVRKVNSLGIITTVAGTSSGVHSGDGGPATSAGLYKPDDIAFDTAGNMYISEYSTYVRKVNTSGIISTVVGNGTLGYSGDGGPATAAAITLPTGIVTDQAGNLYIADYAQACIRKVNTSGIISTYAGTGVAGFSGDGGPATAAQIDHPLSLAIDNIGNIYFSNYGGYNRVRKIDTSGIITTVAGGAPGFALGDGGLATAATLWYPTGVAVDGIGNLFISDNFRNRVRKVNASGIISTYAGGGWSLSNGVLATTASIDWPMGLTVDHWGNLYMCLANDQKVRKVNGGLYFTGGHSIHFGVCENTSYDSINSILDVTLPNNPDTVTWSLVSGPYHGSAAISYTGGCSCSDITPHTLSYTPASGYTGYDTFRVRASDVNSSDTTTVYVTVSPTPSVITGTSVVCAGSTVTLSDSVSGGIWSSSNNSVATIGSTTGIVTGVSAGVDTITYSMAGGCKATMTVTVESMPGPITGVSTTCIGATTTLYDASGGTWTSSAPSIATIGSTTGIVTGISAGTVTMTFTMTAGCSVTFAMTVFADPTPITGVRSVCAGATTTLTDTVTGGSWTSSSTGVASIGSASGFVTGISGGVTTITYAVALGALCRVTETFTVTPFPGPIGGTPAVCAGSTTTLTDGGGGTWSASNGNASIGSITGVVTGYTVGLDTITYATGPGCAATLVITVNTNPAPITGLSTICTGSSIVLSDTSAGGHWSSSNGSASIGMLSGIVTGVAAGIDTISYTTSGGCASTKIITVNALPTISAGAGVTICPGSSTTLTATGGTTYTWSPPTGLSATTGATLTASPTATTTYTVTGTTAGCNGIATVTVTIGSGLTISAGPNMAICSGSSTSITATGGTTYTWSPGTGLSATTGATVTANPTTTTTYTITGATGSCTGSATKTVSVNAVPTISAGSGVVICSGSSATLTASGGTTYIWSPSTGLSATTGATVMANPTTTTTYTVTGTTAGCNGIATKTVTVNALPTISAGAGVTICPGSSTTMTATGGTTYTWSPSAGLSATTGATVTATPTVTTTYTVTGTTAGCSGTATKTVNIGGSLTVSAGTGTAICSGSSTTLTATGGTTYTWSPSTGLSATTGTSVTAHPASTTTYTVTGMTGTCTGTSTTTVTVNALPIISASPGTTICVGLSATLTASGGTTYTWSPATGLSTTTGASVTASPTTTTTYTVIGTTAGCNGTATTTVTVGPGPTISAGGGVAICAGSTTAITATGGTTYTWSPSTGLSATTGATVIAFPATTTTYTVTGTTSGCIGTATKTVTVNTSAGAISGSTSVCQGMTTTLSETMSGGMWSSSNRGVATVGSATGVVTGVSAGAVTITYTSGSGCKAIWPMTVTPLPSAITGGSTSVCPGGTMALRDATPGGLWSSSNPTIATVSTSGVVTGGMTGGVVTISYTLLSGCAATRMVTVTSLPPITGLTNLCAWTDTIIAHDANPAGLYSSTLVTVVNTGGGNGIVAAAAAGIAHITYTLPSGCSVSATLTVNPIPGLITGSNRVNVGSTTTLSNSMAGGAWSSGAPAIATIGSATGVVMGVSVGTAYVTYTLPTGCSTDTQVHVTTPPIHKETSPAVGNENTGDADIRVTPNPNKGVFSISGTISSTKEEEDIYAEVTNMLGQVVLRKRFTALHGKIEEDILLGDVANGMYLLNVQWSGGNKVTHLVVSR